MDILDEEAYNELRSKLLEMVEAVAQNAAAMRTAAIDCVDNSRGDESARKASDALSKCAAVITEEADAINEVIRKMDREMNEAHESDEIAIGGV